MHSNFDSVDSGQVRIKGHLCTNFALKHENLTGLFAISITYIYITQASNSGYLPPRTIFHGCQIVYWVQNKVVLKMNWFWLCENAWFPWQPVI